MKIKRIATLVLAIAIGMTSFLLVGCADTKGPSGDDPDLVTVTQLPLSFGGEKKDFEGETVLVLTTTDRLRTQAFNIIDLVKEDNLGDDAIVTAVDERNQRLKAVFNFEIERSPEADFGNVAKQAMLNADDSYRFYMLKVQGGLEIAASTGALVDMYSSTYVDLSRDYWDNAIVENLLLAGGAYIATGDINTVDDDCCWCVLFNKQLYKEETHNEPTDLYNKVLEGDNKTGGWTTEYMKALAAANFRPDTNTSEKWRDDYAGTGTYSIITQNEVATVLLQSSGNTPTLSDPNNTFGFRANMSGNTDFMDAVQDVFDFMGGSEKGQWNLNMDTIPSNVSHDKWETVARGGFKRGISMFYITHVGTINLVRDMEAEFGILPIPKLDASQEKYGNTIQYGNATCYVIPSFNDDRDEESGYILEAMCYYSSPEYFEAMEAEDKSLRTAYRETVLKRKATRDDESMEMLDLVFNNRIFDLACALNLSGVNGALQGCCVSTTSPEIESTIKGMANLESTIKDLLKPLLRVLSGS